jgi:Tfp pilus assembly protein PilX
MRVRASNSEAGFTMVATLLATVMITALALVAVTAVRGDLPLASHDIGSKKAYEAARAGVEDYASHLYADSLYWTKCAGVAEPSAVNLKGSTTKRRAVPGDPTETYAIELLPASDQSTYTQCSTAAPGPSMLESSGPAAGAFRVRSTGYAGGTSTPIVATFKRPSFLDYVYFTQLETLDPIAYGYANPSTALTGAYSQCELTYEEKRQDNPIPGTGGRDYCETISFITNDAIEGPMHTNDAFAICGSPQFGRNTQDMIEMGGKSPGWYNSGCSGSSPKFEGTPLAPAPNLVPPESNSKLSSIALPQFHYTGQVRICLNGTNMTVGNGETCEGVYSGSIPSNGVIYVSNGSCSSVYSPFNTKYEASQQGCGNVYVKGTYTGQLTIAAENDVIINGNLCRTSCTSPSGEALLGLIANNFVRVYHPCSSSTNGSGSLSNPTIDAAILAIKHSFIVDNFNCGNALGTLNVEGAIAQKFRGPVGTGGTGGSSNGYLKNYVYDDRLRYLEPPSFIEPTGASWIIGRETQG